MESHDYWGRKGEPPHFGPCLPGELGALKRRSTHQSIRAGVVLTVNAQRFSPVANGELAGTPPVHDRRRRLVLDRPGQFCVDEQTGTRPTGFERPAAWPANSSVGPTRDDDLGFPVKAERSIADPKPRQPGRRCSSTPVAGCVGGCDGSIKRVRERGTTPKPPRHLSTLLRRSVSSSIPVSVNPEVGLPATRPRPFTPSRFLRQMTHYRGGRFASTRRGHAATDREISTPIRIPVPHPREC